MTAPLVFFNPQAAPAVLLAQQLRAIQKRALVDQAAGQFEQLTLLLAHAHRYSPFWRDRLAAVNYGSATIDAHFLKSLPILTRQDLQENFDALQAKWPDLKEEDIFSVTSSGSTGKPVRVQKFRKFQNPLDSAHTLIELEWHNIDPHQTIASLGFGVEDQAHLSWGGIFQALHYKWRCLTRNVTQHSLESHLDWLMKEKPAYLKVSPFVAAQLARLALDQKKSLPIKAIICQSEKVSAVHRALCKEAFGATIIDRYSSEETGLIALQCPTHHDLHVMSAGVIVEIVNASGQACAIGEVGKVLVTNLVSYAMPLIRYDLGDFASWGPACNCGMTLPVISKLWGRVRNSVIHADGSAHPMGFLGDDIGIMPNILEFKIEQYLGKELYLELVCKQALNQEEINQIHEIFAKNGLSDLWLFIMRVSKLTDDGQPKREEFKQVGQNGAFPQEAIKIRI